MESSQAWKATGVPSALQSFCSSISRIASTCWLERSAESPCIGRSETIRPSGVPLPPNSTLPHVSVETALTAVVASAALGAASCRLRRRRRRSSPAESDAAASNRKQMVRRSPQTAAQYMQFAVCGAAAYRSRRGRSRGALHLVR